MHEQRTSLCNAQRHAEAACGVSSREASEKQQESSNKAGNKAGSLVPLLLDTDAEGDSDEEIREPDGEEQPDAREQHALVRVHSRRLHAHHTRDTHAQQVNISTPSVWVTRGHIPQVPAQHMNTFRTHLHDHIAPSFCKLARRKRKAPKQAAPVILEAARRQRAWQATKRMMRRGHSPRWPPHAQPCGQKALGRRAARPSLFAARPEHWPLWSPRLTSCLL